MKCHQILTGACNPGDKTFAVGSVQGVRLTAYAAGCNITILANNFQRVQIIPGICHNNVQISCVDVSNNTGKVAVAYENKVHIYLKFSSVRQKYIIVGGVYSAWLTLLILAFLYLSV